MSYKTDTYDTINEILNLKIKDETIRLYVEKLENKIETLDTVEEADLVLKIIDSVYNALATPFFYESRKIDISSNYTQDLITKILDSLEDITREVKKHKILLEEVNELECKKRLPQEFDGKVFDKCYDENPGNRLPNRVRL